jgi:OOP family OmpA-OmpF porin
MFNKNSLVTLTLAGIAGLFIATTASATAPGPYFGGQLGWGNTYNTELNDDFGVKDNGALAGRVYAGFQLNDIFSAEMGYTKFSNVNLSDTGFFAVPTGVTYGTLSAQVKTYAVDAVAKASLPLQSGFSIFGKFGAAYVNQASNASLSSPTYYNQVNETDTAILPTFGLGLSYDINKNVVADVSWMRIQKTGDTSIDSTDTATVGLSYHFG